MLYRFREKEIHLQEIKNLYGLLGDICKRIQLNQMQEWMERLTPYFEHSDSLFSCYRLTQKEEKAYRKNTILKYRNQKYAHCRKAYKLANTNLKLIKKLRKYSFYNRNEDSLFREGRKTAWKIRQRFIEMNVDRLQDRIDFKQYKMDEFAVAQHLIKYYSYEIGVEKLRSKKRKNHLLREYKGIRNYAKSRLDWSVETSNIYAREMLMLKRLIKEERKKKRQAEIQKRV